MRAISYKIFFLICLSGLLFKTARANHIIGGELTYKYISKNTYQFQLKIFRDCNSLTPYDTVATLYVFDNKFNLVDSVKAIFPGATRVTPVLNNPCATLPSGICVEEAVYLATATLPDNTGGLYVAYQRCCRNTAIVNIVLPGNTGSTYMAYIPATGKASINSSPYFKSNPPLVICASLPIYFDMSATDPDSDSLVYSMYTPNNGATPTAPWPDPASAPPYDTVAWVSGYSVSNQIGGKPALNIDSKTGRLTGFPCCIGIYVIGVSVKEYRNGILLSETRRDFEFIVINCKPQVVAAFNTPTPYDTITLCGINTLQIVNNSYGKTFTYNWNFGNNADPLSNKDTATNPSYTYPDTGYYRAFLYVNKGQTCFDTTWRIISIRKNVKALFKTDTACYTSHTHFTDESYSGNTPYIKYYNWQFGDSTSSTLSNPLHAYPHFGSYKAILLVKDKYGCTNADTTNVTVLYNILSGTIADTVICHKDTISLRSGAGSAYKWLPVYNINNTSIAAPRAWPKKDTSYIAQVMQTDGCMAYDTSRIHIIDTVIIAVTKDTSLCHLASVKLWASGARQYIWHPGTTLSDSLISSPVATPTSVVTYTCIGLIGTCSTQQSVRISVLPLPYLTTVDSATINQGQTYGLGAKTNGIEYIWTPPSTLSNDSILHPIAKPLNTTTYTITVIGADGCINKDSVVVLVTHIHKFYMPNAFSPNGDGINDVLQFYQAGIKKLKAFRIYNRWGQCVFYSSDLNAAWDGTFKNQPEDVGVYVYYFEAETYDGDTIIEKGNITLLK